MDFSFPHFYLLFLNIFGMEDKIGQLMIQFINLF